MRVVVEGQVLKKEVRQGNGDIKQRKIVHLFQYQEGQVIPVKFVDNDAVFDKIVENKAVKLDCVVSVWEMNGKAGLTCKCVDIVA